MKIMGYEQTSPPFIPEPGNQQGYWWFEKPNTSKIALVIFDNYEYLVFKNPEYFRYDQK